jgi:hypothetical protein
MALLQTAASQLLQLLAHCQVNLCMTLLVDTKLLLQFAEVQRQPQLEHKHQVERLLHVL